MPTVLRVGPYRLFFYTSDRPEPAHTHVERESKRAKLWLDPVRLYQGSAFRDPELARIVELVTQNQNLLQRAWDDYFRD